MGRFSQAVLAVFAFSGSTLAQNTLNYLCMGDSLTVGSGQNVRGGGYRWYLRDMLSSRNKSIDFLGSETTNPGGLLDKEHEGHSGWSSQDLLFGRDGEGDVSTWIQEYQPDCVLVMIGRNDAWPWRDTQSTFRGIANAIYAKKPNATIFWSNVILPASKNAYEIEHCEIVDSAIRTLQNEQIFFHQKIILVDCYRTLYNRSDIYSDDIHLNDTGYCLVAQLFERAIMLKFPNAGAIKK